MANVVYKRISTDQQSTGGQNLVLDQAGIEDPVVFEEDSGTSSRLRPLQRPKFRHLLTCSPAHLRAAGRHRAHLPGRHRGGPGPARGPPRVREPCQRPSGRYNRTMTNLPSLLGMAGH
ncbi:hypothetical protein ABZ119_04845 [Streptomyces sp. NPDC006288]|uniref:hypothetical protein n=1 Tax=Streptomyces sp. NPDC006288 TaxID=3156743 RepID=UPI0033AB3856